MLQFIELNIIQIIFFEFIDSKQNTTEDRSELDMITLLHELIHSDRKIHYDDAYELKII